MPAPSSTPIDVAAVQAESVVRSFGSLNALAGVDLTIPAGELVALIGANGSGKSTLMKLIVGALRPNGGTLRTLGLDPTDGARRLRSQLGYASQEIALDPEMTGRETLRLFHALRGMPRAQREHDLASTIGDFELGSFCDRRVAGYSGGQRQRLHLALETIHGPRLLLLDEPTANLDPGGRADLWRRLAGWREGGRTVIVITHDLADAAAHCDRIVLLADGRLMAQAAPQALVGEHSRMRTVITLENRVDTPALKAMLRTELEALPGAPEAAIADYAIILWRDRNPDGAEPALDLLAHHGIGYTRCERHGRDLEGAYLRLAGRALDAAAASPDEPGRRGNRARGSGGGNGSGRSNRGGRA